MTGKSEQVNLLFVAESSTKCHFIFHNGCVFTGSAGLRFYSHLGNVFLCIFVLKMIICESFLLLIHQVETVTDSEAESKGLPQFHSIGIQVEAHKRCVPRLTQMSSPPSVTTANPHFITFSARHGRFKRSNSVTTAVQADMELEGFPSMEDKGLQFGGAFGRHSEPSTPTQYGAIRTVRTQGLFSYREDYRPSSGPPSPQPEPWLVEPSLESTDTGRMSPLRRDGSWFMQLLHNETKRLEGWCKEMEREAEEHDMSEESEYPEGFKILYIYAVYITTQ